MRAFFLASWLLLTPAGLAMGSNQVPYLRAPGSSERGESAAARACFSHPGDLLGNVVDSEQILMYGLESEVADDFSLCPGGPHTIPKVIAWGSYFDWHPGDPDVPAYNLRFYQDAGGLPGSEIASCLNLVPTSITYFGDNIYGAPCYQIEFDVSVGGILGATVYWLGVQASDHDYPPRWGRQQADSFFGSLAAYRSAFWGFPDWVPASEAFVGLEYDASQEFG